MADYIKAYNITMRHEGGYSLDSSDVGGETYKGISRRFHPTWPGWEIIDRYKIQDNFPQNLKDSKELPPMVSEFYKQHYWDKFLGDEIKNQDVAEEMFDTAVNMGISRVVKFLQQALNYLNRNEELFSDLVEDGKIGNNTLKALDIYLKEDGNIYLLKIMNVLQGMHYLNYMSESPIQEKYCRGWFKRVEIGKRREEKIWLR